MLESYFRNLIEGRQVRQTLIDLRKKLKDGDAQALEPEQLAQLRPFLSHEDAKVRRNAALILGEQKFEKRGRRLDTVMRA